MRPSLRAWLGAFLILVTQNHVAMSAVRKCGPVVSSEIVRAATEIEAKKKALGEWRVKALALGTNFDNWRLAAEKSLKCFKAQDGYECVAFGQPCIIDQTPNTPAPKPEGGPASAPEQKKSSI